MAEVLEAAEIELDRRVIAREELVEALATSPAGTTAEAEAERETAPSQVPVPGSTVPGRACVRGFPRTQALPGTGSYETDQLLALRTG